MCVCVCVCVYVVERFGDGREQMPSFSAESHLVLSDSLRIDRTPPPHRPMHAISYTIFLFLFFLVSSLSSYSGPSLLYLQFQPPSPPPEDPPSSILLTSSAVYAVSPSSSPSAEMGRRIEANQSGGFWIRFLSLRLRFET